jgi:hypothetical protein
MALFLGPALHAVGYNRPNAAPLTRELVSGVCMQSYCLKAAIPAILDKPGGDKISATLPVGALLEDCSETSTILLGMVGVSWRGRRYSVYLVDLLQKAERVSTA